MNLSQLDWQTVVALIIVFSAIAILARKTWRTLFRPSTSGCGTACRSCPSKRSAGTVKVTELIQLKSPCRDEVRYSEARSSEAIATSRQD